MAEANANPEKRFFIELITRDISLEDAILDMIDNAIDSLVRTKNIDIYKDYINPSKIINSTLANISINYSSKQFIIEDNCGGISFKSAEDDVFRFGHPDPHSGASLSVFGIGMKRAIFKIGRHIKMESRTSVDGFSMELDVNKWLAESTTDWRIPINKEEGVADLSKAGTKIIISKLRDEVSSITANPTFHNRLNNMVREAYPFYLGKYICISINKNIIEGEDLKFAESDEIRPTIESWDDGRVRITLICGLLPRDPIEWTTEKSGWYLVCNGRVVVRADKTKLTGWGGLLPQFMPKNRGFLGIVFFRSDHPEELPWKTTKQGVNTESQVYIRTLKKMIIASRLVVQFQNKMYESGDDTEAKGEYRESLRDLRSSSASLQAAKSSIDTSFKHQGFTYRAPTSGPKLVSIQFKVREDDLIRVKKCMGRVSLSNKEVGENIFKYYIDRECPK